MKVCIACKKELEPVFANEDTDYQFDNALWIGFFGGYGMFVESYEYLGDSSSRIIKNSSYEAVLCHDCAHELCEQYPWINDLLDPLKSHSHTIEYWENHPDHQGWDNPFTPEEVQ